MNLAEIKALEIKGTTEQCSDAWFNARVGKITGSGMYSLSPHLAGDGSIGRVRYDYRKKYIAQKVHEGLSGKCYEIETNARMEHGVKYEAEARKEYCKRFGNKV
ncbi:MAG: YqaJ viral recombinase family protein, partial [Candidatus Nezhaarchaeales archaeon]